jgi:hypothetical protein
MAPRQGAAESWAKTRCAPSCGSASAGAAANHLRSYLKPLGITAYKIGVTGRRSTWDRIMDLRASSYAGALCNEQTHETALLEEADDWFQMPLQDDSMGLWDLPACVTLDRNTIVLRLSSHYRSKERPDDVLIVHPKTGVEVWWPLFDPEQPGKVPLFPELMARLDEIKTTRIGGLMIVRDWKDVEASVPVAWPAGKKGDLTHLRHETKRLIRMAELPDNLSFSAFRHGGLTEGGDADMTDREVLAQSAQKSPKVLPRYVKKTMKQVANGARKRRASRTDGGHLSE